MLLTYNECTIDMLSSNDLNSLLTIPLRLSSPESTIYVYRKSIQARVSPWWSLDYPETIELHIFRGNNIKSMILKTPFFLYFCIYEVIRS